MARRKKREGHLHKVLGVPALFSTAYGNVGSSIYYALGVVALSALGLTPVVFMLTGLLFVTTAWSYAEATTMFPEAGGSSSFARHTFNEFVSFGAGWALMLDYIITIAISAFFVPNYLATFWPVLKTWPYNSIGGIATIVFVVVINVVGIKEAARVNIILAIADLSTQTLLAIVGLFVFLAPRTLITQVHFGTAPTVHQFVYGISIGTVAYTGIETISNMAEESSNPGRDVPRAVNFVLLAVLGVYFAISMVGLSAMPVHYNVVPVDPHTHMTISQPILPDPGKQAKTGPWHLASAPGEKIYILPNDSGTATKSVKATGTIYLQDGHYVTKVWGTQLGTVYEADPLQGLVQNLPKNLNWLRYILAPWIALLAATILIIATNAGIIGSSRLAYSMAGHKQLPPVLARVHPTRFTPYVSITLFGLIAALLILPGKIGLLADLYAFGAMISFTVAHLCVVALRIKQPDAERPWRLPLNIPFGRYALPLTAMIGGLGTASVWVVVVLTHADGRLVGFSWMGAGIVMYVVYRKRKGYSLTQTVKAVPLPESVQSDIDYDQLLVPIVGSRITDEMMVLACQLATEKQSAVDALYVIEVPFNLPLDARLPAEREKAKAVLEQAAVVADQFGVTMTPIVVTARAAGRAIVDEAKERRSEVIILGATRKRRFSERAFGRTIDYVLQHASCEVLINLVPLEGVYVEDGKPGAPGATGPSHEHVDVGSPGDGDGASRAAGAASTAASDASPAGGDASPAGGDATTAGGDATTAGGAAPVDRTAEDDFGPDWEPSAPEAPTPPQIV
jgi:APA family basic amino acid/polyamine antiporter